MHDEPFAAGDAAVAQVERGALLELNGGTEPAPLAVAPRTVCCAVVALAVALA